MRKMLVDEKRSSINTVKLKKPPIGGFSIFNISQIRIYKLNEAPKWNTNWLLYFSNAVTLESYRANGAAASAYNPKPSVKK